MRLIYSILRFTSIFILSACGGGTSNSSTVDETDVEPSFKVTISAREQQFQTNVSPFIFDGYSLDIDISGTNCGGEKPNRSGTWLIKSADGATELFGTIKDTDEIISKLSLGQLNSSGEVEFYEGNFTMELTIHCHKSKTIEFEFNAYNIAVNKVNFELVR